MSARYDALERQWTALAPEALEAPTPRVHLIVLRTGDHRHETPAEAELTCEEGLVGDRWVPKRHGPDDQVSLMHVEAARLVAAGEQPLHLPGDNFLVDVDLSEAALPVGSRLRLGEALLEVTPVPHTGCGLFATRFGTDALEWVNAKAHPERRLRGVLCRVVEPGRVHLGDPVRREG